tara:strand:+ start:252 stop:503 length:252 start_codon:yes stop_codon:yes gene_type:complete
MEKVTEYIYLNDDGTIYGTSRNHPMKYEDQTDCIVIECSSEFDMDRLLDLLIPQDDEIADPIPIGECSVCGTTAPRIYPNLMK